MTRKSKREPSKRIVTDQEVMKYEPLVKKYMRDSIRKNWTEASIYDDQNEIALGNTGMSMADMKQFLFTEVVVALQNYDPNYRTKEGNPVKELTFVFQHLSNRVGQKMKRLTSKHTGYGIWNIELGDALRENGEGEL